MSSDYGPLRRLSGRRTPVVDEREMNKLSNNPMFRVLDDVAISARMPLGVPKLRLLPSHPWVSDAVVVCERTGALWRVEERPNGLKADPSETEEDRRLELSGEVSRRVVRWVKGERDLVAGDLLYPLEPLRVVP